VWDRGVEIRKGRVVIGDEVLSRKSGPRNIFAVCCRIKAYSVVHSLPCDNDLSAMIVFALLTPYDVRQANLLLQSNHNIKLVMIT